MRKDKDVWLRGKFSIRSPYGYCQFGVGLSITDARRLARITSEALGSKPVTLEHTSCAPSPVVYTLENGAIVAYGPRE